MGYLDSAGLSYLWSKVKNYVDSKAGGGPSELTLNLTAAGWSLNSDGYYYQTATASGVTASNTVIVNTDQEIKCTAQAANTLTFRANQAAAASIKVMIFEQ